MNEVIWALQDEFLHHGEWLLSATLKATAWLMIVLAILRLARRASASVRHAIAVAAAVGVPLIFLMDMSPIPGSSGWRPFARSATPVTAPGPGAQARVQLMIEAITANAPGSEKDNPIPANHTGNSSHDPVALIVALWWIGMLAATIRFSRRIRKPRLKESALRAESQESPAVVAGLESIRLGLKHAPDLWIQEGAMPMTFGLRYPAVVLPTEAAAWPPEKVATILRHELMHVRRHDLWWTLIVEAALLPVWWHPLARFLKRQISELAEQACDDAVVLSGSAPEVYAGYLLSLSRRFIPIRQAALGLPAISRVDRVARFRRLLDETVCRRAVSPSRIALIAFAALSVVVPGTLFLSVATAEPEEPSATAPSEDNTPRATAQRIAGVSRDARQLMITVKFYESDITDGRTLENPDISAWMEGEERFLSPESGFQMFHPQATGVDILIAPKIVVLPGQEAKVEVLRELIYPATLEVEPGADEKKPEEFNSANTGIVMTLKVHTTDDPEYLQVELGPTVSELIGFSTSDAGLWVPDIRTQGEPYAGPFRNGSYLMIGEHTDKQSIEDHLPVLGDIPLIGHLFRGESVRELRKVIAVQVIVSESR